MPGHHIWKNYLSTLLQTTRKCRPPCGPGRLKVVPQNTGCRWGPCHVSRVSDESEIAGRMDHLPTWNFRESVGSNLRQITGNVERTLLRVRARKIIHHGPQESLTEKYPTSQHVLLSSSDVRVRTFTSLMCKSGRTDHSSWTARHALQNERYTVQDVPNPWLRCVFAPVLSKIWFDAAHISETAPPISSVRTFMFFGENLKVDKRCWNLF
jgi:hypothetical protein